MALIYYAYKFFQKMFCPTETDTPQQHQPSYPLSQPGAHGKPFQNGDSQHHDDPQYTSLRERANAEGNAMRVAFEKAHFAHENGDGALANSLSHEGHDHQRLMEQYNREAADWIFQANNAGSTPGTIDLHGLYVHEAIQRSEQAIQQAQAQGQPTLRIIVGKGLHSQDHVAKLKPAIEDLMQRYRLAAELDPENEGVLIVHLNGAGSGRGMDANEMTRRLDQGDKCTIM